MYYIPGLIYIKMVLGNMPGIQYMSGMKIRDYYAAAIIEHFWLN